MRNQLSKVSYDTLVIGGGPAGLSAAIYLGRAQRTVAIFDSQEPGRSDWVQINHNYLGFPNGIAIRDLAKSGRRQAKKFGAVIINKRVISVTRRPDELFEVSVDGATFSGHTVILATGVRDLWIEFPGFEDYIGRSMHLCITCDGYEMQGKRVLVVGNNDEAIEVALQLQHFAKQVLFLTESGKAGLTTAKSRQLTKRGIDFHRGRIVSARSTIRGMVSSVKTDSGERIQADHLFSLLGAIPNSELAELLGAKLSAEGFIKVDTEARTSVPNVFAAGDVTRLFSHQVVTAAHEGGTAATAIAYDLYVRDKK